jgi:hypothetical protein
MVTLSYTSRLRISLTLAQPVIGNWPHAYTWDNARRLDTLTGSSGSFDYDYIAAASSGDYASRLVKRLTVPTIQGTSQRTKVAALRLRRSSENVQPSSAMRR